MASFMFQFCIGIFLRLGPCRLYVPIEASNIQMRVRNGLFMK